MQISRDTNALRAYRSGDLGEVAALLGGKASTLGQACSQCGNRISRIELAVMANDAMGWQIAHPHCVGADAEIEPELPRRLVALQAPDPIDYTKARLPTRQAIVRALVEADADYGGDGNSLSLAARKLIDQAIGGNLTAWREIADRLDGKASQSVDVRSVNINATARDLSEAELDEILAKHTRRRSVPSVGTTFDAQVIDNAKD